MEFDLYGGCPIFIRIMHNEGPGPIDDPINLEIIYRAVLCIR